MKFKLAIHVIPLTLTALVPVFVPLLQNSHSLQIGEPIAVLVSGFTDGSASNTLLVVRGPPFEENTSY